MASSQAPVSRTGSTPLPWLLLYGRAGLLIGLGAVLFLTGNQPSQVALIAESVLLFAAGLTAFQFYRSSSGANNPDYWFLISGLLDMAFGVGLLFYWGNPTKGAANLFGGWGVLVGITQAVATMYTFLGVKDESESGQDMTVVILHFINALLGGGIAFMLVQRPADDRSLQFSGLFPVAMGVLLLVLIRRLKADIIIDQSQQSGG